MSLKYKNYLTKRLLRGLSFVYQEALDSMTRRMGSTDLDLNYYEVWLEQEFDGQDLIEEKEKLASLKWLLKFISIEDSKRANELIE